MKKRYYIIPSVVCLVFGISILALFLNIKANLHEGAVETVMSVHKGVKVLDRGTMKFSGIDYESDGSIYLMWVVNDLSIFCEDGMCRTLSDMETGANLSSIYFDNGEPEYEQMTVIAEPLLWEDAEITNSLKQEECE